MEACMRMCVKIMSEKEREEKVLQGSQWITERHVPKMFLTADRYNLNYITIASPRGCVSPKGGFYHRRGTTPYRRPKKYFSPYQHKV